MSNDQLEYRVPFRLVTYIWLSIAIATAVSAVWTYPFTELLVFIFVVFLWSDIGSAILHYAMDSPEFTTLPLVGESVFSEFQSHHFSKWINTIYQKPVIDLLGQLNFVAWVGLPLPIIYFGLSDQSIYVAWAFLMLGGCYAQMCHRWAHQPRRSRSFVAVALQRSSLAIKPVSHFSHHNHECYGINFAIGSGWSNPLMNWIFQLVPSRVFWLLILILALFSQVFWFGLLLHWIQS